jgi:hypothetical protein
VNGIQIIGDFPGASIASYKWDGNKLMARLRSEIYANEIDGSTIDYGLHFLFGIHNQSPHQVEIDVIVSNGEPPVRPLFENRLFTSNDPTKEFVRSELINLMDGQKWNSFQIQLQPNEKLYISNTQWRPYTYLQSLFDRLAEENGFSRFVYGHSFQGRELVAYKNQRTANDVKHRPKILVTSGLHPMEPDTWGPEAIMERLNKPQANDLMESIEVILAPIVNPDGFELGNNGVTANEINILWDFRYQDPQACPEAVSLWNLVQEATPWVYIDFHCYSVHGKTKTAGPYVKPVSYYTGKSARECAKTVLSEVSKIPDTKQLIKFPPSASFTKLTQETNVITLAKYHLHVDLGKDGSKNLAWQVFENTSNALLDHKWTQDELLFRPAGKLKKTIFVILKYWGYNLFHLSRSKIAKLVRIARN